MMPQIGTYSTGQSVDSVAVVLKSEVRRASNGNDYVAGELRDATGTIGFKQFGSTWAPSVGSVVRYVGTVDEFQGKADLKLDNLTDAPEGDFTAHLLPVSDLFSLDEVERGVRAFIHDEIRNDDIRAICNALLDELGDDFFRAPAAAKMHHAFVGGLAEHTLSLLNLAKRNCEHYDVFGPGLIDPDVLYAGVLFHDSCKVREYDAVNHAFVFTRRGALLGHVMDGALLVYKAFGLAGVKDDHLRERIAHIVLSHHGKAKFGAPVDPLTPEAILFHELDMIDSRIGAMRRLKPTANERDGASQYDRMFYGSVYFESIHEPEPKEENQCEKLKREWENRPYDPSSDWPDEAVFDARVDQ